MSFVIAIPARLASSRLPNKPLLDIDGEPIIVHVWRRATEAQVGRVVVAAADEEIVRVVEAAGGEAVLTPPDLPSGSDRIFNALRTIDPDGTFDHVINLQGDLPNLDPKLIQNLATILLEGDADIVTLAAPITNNAEHDDPNVVKAVIALGEGARLGRALYFTRATAPAGDGPLYHHIGIYGFTRAALERFIALSSSPLERRERLEQLRALEAGICINVGLVDTVPTGVDTPADLEKARQEMAAKPE
jgi:3-deoxy-manno-octulosonate cytidylyltransferase (CMP-KDO synthetase)